MTMMALVLAAVCVTNFVAQSVDKRLETADPAKSLSRFASYPSNAARGGFRANPAFWAKDVDFSCASPWNSDRGRLKAGTAISKRHVVFAKHFPLAVGTRIVFVGDGGDTSAYYIEKTKAMKRGDIMIGLLNAELTPDVHPAKVLPDNWTNYFPKIEGMPVVTLSQHEKALVNELMPPLLEHCGRLKRMGTGPAMEATRHPCRDSMPVKITPRICNPRNIERPSPRRANPLSNRHVGFSQGSQILNWHMRLERRPAC